MATKAAKQQGAALLDQAKQGAQTKGLELANQAKQQVQEQGIAFAKGAQNKLQQQGASAISNLGPSSVTGILQSKSPTSNVESITNAPTSEPSVGNTMSESLDAIKINEEKDQEKIERIEAFKEAFKEMLTDDTSDERVALAVFIKEQIKEYEAILLPAIGNSMPMEPNAKRYFLEHLYGTMKGDPQTDIPSANIKPTAGGKAKAKSKKKRTKKPKLTRRRR